MDGETGMGLQGGCLGVGFQTLLNRALVRFTECAEVFIT